MRTHRVASIVAGHVAVLTILVGSWFGSSLGPALYGAFAQTSCPSGDSTYVVRLGDTLGSIGTRTGKSWQTLASHNNLANPNLIFINQHICIPGGSSSSSSSSGVAAVATTSKVSSTASVRGTSNPFPYGQCTWWASQRYFQLTGIYVPWTTNANAYQWAARALDFNWRVSAQPVAGSIMVLQPNVQGASSLGHVGVVERVYSDGRVMASSMNWGPNYSQVSTFVFSPGAGVSFVYVR